jgi:hypothetical protein
MTTDLPLALDLRVGMGIRSTARESDLDNYLEPVVRHLGASRFSAVFGTKRAGETRPASFPLDPRFDPSDGG